MAIELRITAETADDLRQQTLALAGQFGVSAPVVSQSAPVNTEPGEPPARRGRKPKGEVTEAPTAPTEAAETVQDAPTQAAPVSAPTPAETPATVDKDMLQKKLIEVVQKFGAAGDGRALCGAICKAHGGSNLSALQPSTYAAAYRDAVAVLALSPEDARAQWLTAPATV